MTRRLLSLGMIVILLAPVVRGQSSDPQVVSGTASFQQNGASWTVTTSDQAVINWQRFDVPAGSTMQFVQPAASSLVVNRVIGPYATYINGLLTANGRLYLINPHGITVGPTGTVSVNEFIASTLNPSNAELLSGGDINFVGISPAAIENFGQIEAIGGDIYLVAAHVSNQGTLSAPAGKVGLAAGNDVLLTQDKELFVRPTGLASVGGTGVDNSGLVEAVSVELKAHGNMYDLAVNTSGVVRAAGFGFQDGRVVLRADGGTVVSSGVLAAKTVDAKGKTTGGEVQVLGRQVSLLDGSVIDVSGDLGGGQVNVGGSYQGKGPLPNAEKTVVLSGARITADALESGDGGQVVVWSDDYTLFDGQISARGGGLGGNGGLVETSCRDLLVVSAGQVDCGAPWGQGGNWLLDPYNVQIVAGGGTSVGSWDGSVFTATGNGAQIGADTIAGALNGGTSVTVHTGTGGKGKDGHITFSDDPGAAITKTTVVDATLRLEAHKNIIVTQPITSTLGLLNVELQAGGTVDVNAAIDTNGGYVTVTSGDKLTLDKNVTAGAGQVTLNPNKGGVDQTDGKLTADELLLKGGGTFNLDQVGNNVTTLAAEINGALTYRDTDGLTVGTVGLTNGIDAGNDDVTLNITAGGVDQTDPLTADGLLLLGGGDFILDHAGNNVDTLAANITGALTYTNANGLTVGTVGGINGINAGDKNVTLKTTAGGVDQSGAGVLTAGGLLLLGGGTFDLDHASNNVVTLAAEITGALTYTDGGALTVGTVGVTEGISTGGDNAVTLNTGGMLTLTKNVTAGAALVTLEPTAGGVNQMSGSLTAGKLLLKSQQPGGFILDEANNVGTLAADIDGALTFRDADALIVGQIGSIRGIETGGGNVTLNTGGTLTLAQDVTAAGARITLNPTGGVNQTGLLTAGSLLLRGAGDFNLDQARNNVDTLAANIASSLTYADWDDLTIGTVGGVAGIQTSGGDVEINAPKGQILVNQLIDTTPPGAGGVLTVIGDVVFAAAPVLGAGDITLEAQPVPFVAGLLGFFGTTDQSGDYDSRRGQWVYDHMDELTYRELLALRREVEELAGGDVRWAALLTAINSYMEAVVSRMENTTFYKP